MVPAMYVQWFVLFALCLTGVLKIVTPKSLAKDFSFVPMWAWRFVGAWELYASWLIHFGGRYAEAVPLIYMFFGGVIYCVVRSGQFLILPFPLLNVVCACILGINNNVANAANMIVPYMALGAVATTVLCFLPGGLKKSKKN